MIALGLLPIRDADAVGEVRRKLHALLQALELGRIDGTRLAALASQGIRAALAGGRMPALALWLGQGADRNWLQVEFQGFDGAEATGPLRAAFDVVTAGVAAHSLSARKYLPRRTQALAPDRIERLRAYLAQPSRAELMRELKLKNEELAGYNARLEATVAERTAELRSAHDHMREDLEAGADYVRRLLPEPIEGDVAALWHYAPCANLGGDTFGYLWLDPEHFACFLLDVTGHGIDSALLAVTVAHVLRGRALAGADMRDPASVLCALNAEFPAERHDGKLFTVWYGVYARAQRRLSWAGGGHPPAILIERGAARPIELDSTGPIIGAIPDFEFESCHRALTLPAEIFVFSDGCFEFKQASGERWSYGALRDFLVARGDGSREQALPHLLRHVVELQPSGRFDDDLSIVHLRFGQSG